MKKILLLDAISFQVDPNDEIWRYENVAQIKYAAKRENSRIIVQQPRFCITFVYRKSFTKTVIMRL